MMLHKVLCSPGPIWYYGFLALHLSVFADNIVKKHRRKVV